MSGVKRVSGNVQSQRHEVALLAAKLLYERECSEYAVAKRQAARHLRLTRERDLPSNVEVREALLSLTNTMEGEERLRDLQKMRELALSVMKVLEEFSPKLHGSVATGHVRRGSDSDLHVFAQTTDDVVSVLLKAGWEPEVEHKSVLKNGVRQVYHHVRLLPPEVQFTVEITVYSPRELSYRFISSVTGKFIETLNITQLAALLDKG